MAGRLRLGVLTAIAVLPSALACVCYRVFFGYKIGKKVRIGFSIIDANVCEIGDGVTIGHLNIFTRIDKLTVGEQSRIGVLNIFAAVTR